MEIKKLASLDINPILEGVSFSITTASSLMVLNTINTPDRALIPIMITTGVGDIIKVIKYDQNTNTLSVLDDEIVFGVDNDPAKIFIVNASLNGGDILNLEAYFYDDADNIRQLRLGTYNDSVIVAYATIDDEMLPFIPIGGLNDVTDIGNNISYMHINMIDGVVLKLIANNLELGTHSIIDTMDVVEYINDTDSFYIFLAGVSSSFLIYCGANRFTFDDFNIIEIPMVYGDTAKGANRLHKYNNKIYIYGVNSDIHPTLTIIDLSNPTDIPVIKDLIVDYSLPLELELNRLWMCGGFNDNYLYLNQMEDPSFTLPRSFILDLDTLTPVTVTTNDLVGGSFCYITGSVQDDVIPNRKLALALEVDLTEITTRIHVINMPSVSDKVTLEQLDVVDEYEPLIDVYSESLQAILDAYSITVEGEIYSEYDKVNNHLYLAINSQAGSNTILVLLVSNATENFLTYVTHVTYTGPDAADMLCFFKLYDNCIVAQSLYWKPFRYAIIPRTGTTFGQPVYIDLSIADMVVNNDTVYGLSTECNFLYSFDVPALVTFDGGVSIIKPDADMIYSSKSCNGALTILTIEDDILYLADRARFNISFEDRSTDTLDIVKINLLTEEVVKIQIPELGQYDLLLDSPIVTNGSNKYLVSAIKINVDQPYTGANWIYEANIIIIDLTTGKYKIIDGAFSINICLSLDDYIVMVLDNKFIYINKSNLELAFITTYYDYDNYYMFDFTSYGNNIIGVQDDFTVHKFIGKPSTITIPDMNLAQFTNNKPCNEDENIFSLPQASKSLSVGTNKIVLNNGKVRKISSNPILEFKTEKLDQMLDISKLNIMNPGSYKGLNSSISPDGKKLMPGYSSSTVTEYLVSFFDKFRRSDQVQTPSPLNIINSAFNDESDLVLLATRVSPYLVAKPVTGDKFNYVNKPFNGDKIIKAGNQGIAYLDKYNEELVAHFPGPDYQPLAFYASYTIDNPTFVSYAKCIVETVESVGLLLVVNGENRFTLQADGDSTVFTLPAFLAGLTINDHYYSESMGIHFVAHTTGFDLFTTSGVNFKSNSNIFKSFKAIEVDTDTGVVYIIGETVAAPYFKKVVYFKELDILGSSEDEVIFNTPLAEAPIEWSYNGDILAIRFSSSIKIYKFNGGTGMFVLVSSKDGNASSIVVHESNNVYVAYNEKIKLYSENDNYTNPVIFDEVESTISNRIIQKMCSIERGLITLENYPLNGVNNVNINYITLSNNHDRYLYYHDFIKKQYDPKICYSDNIINNKLAWDTAPDPQFKCLAENDKYVAILTNSCFNFYKKDGVSLFKIYSSNMTELLSLDKFSLSDDNILVGITASDIMIFDLSNNEIELINSDLTLPVSTGINLIDVAISDDGKFIVVANDNTANIATHNVFAYKQTDLATLTYQNIAVSRVVQPKATHVKYYSLIKTFLVTAMTTDIVPTCEFIEYAIKLDQSGLEVGSAINSKLYHNEGFGIGYNQTMELTGVTSGVFSEDLSTCILTGDDGDAIFAKVMRSFKGVATPGSSFYKMVIADVSDTVKFGNQNISISKNGDIFAITRTDGIVTGGKSHHLGIAYDFTTSSIEGDYQFIHISKNENVLLTVETNMELNTWYPTYTEKTNFSAPIAALTNTAISVAAIPGVPNTFLVLDELSKLILVEPVYNLTGISHFTRTYLTYTFGSTPPTSLNKPQHGLKVINNEHGIFCSFSIDETYLYKIDIVLDEADRIFIDLGVNPFEPQECIHTFSSDGTKLYILYSNYVYDVGGGIESSTVYVVLSTNGDFSTILDIEKYDVDYVFYQNTAPTDIAEYEGDLFLTVANGIMLIILRMENAMYRGQMFGAIESTYGTTFNLEISDNKLKGFGTGCYFDLPLDMVSLPTKDYALDFDMDANYVYVLTKRLGTTVVADVDKYDITNGSFIERIITVPVSVEYGTIKKIDNNIYLGLSYFDTVDKIFTLDIATITCMKVVLGVPGEFGTGSLDTFMNIKGAPHNLIRFEKIGTLIYMIATVGDYDLSNCAAASFVAILNPDFTFNIKRDMYPKYITGYSIEDDGIELYLTDANIINHGDEEIIPPPVEPI